MKSKRLENPLGIEQIILLITFIGMFLWAGPLDAGEMNGPLFSEIPYSSDLAEAYDRELRNPAINRSRYVEIDRNMIGALQTPSGNALTDISAGLDLNLFDGAAFRAVFDRVKSNRSGSTSWMGRLENVKDSGVVLIVKDGVLVGNITTPWATYQIRYAGPGAHAIYEIDQSQFPPELDAIPAQEYEYEGDALQDPPMAGDDGSIIDVMVVYTGSARSGAGSTPAIQNAIDLAVTETNQGYANSNINQRLNLVHTAEVSYSESSFNWSTTLSRLTGMSDGYMDNVHSLRDTYGADEVVLLVENMSACGIAWVMQNVSSGFEDNAFAVVARGCATGYYSFAHEMGHNMGAAHNIEDASIGGAYNYSHGLKNCPSWKTVMSYGSCTRINHWSNPAISYGGTPTGASNANNRQTLDNTAFTVANFRQSASVQYTLSVQKNGSGSGTVTSNPGGINCGFDCSEDYDEGTPVTLTASTGGDPCITFAGWSGGGCSGTGGCVVTMNNNTNVTATFNIAPPTADFDISTDPGNQDAPLIALFTDDSQCATSWNWNFGDGNTSAEQDPYNVYTYPNYFTVSLTVYNGVGQDTHVDHVSVDDYCNDDPAYIEMVDPFQSIMGPSGAYEDLNSGETLYTQYDTFSEDLLFDRGISFTLDGGYDCPYSTSAAGTTVQSLTIALDTVTVYNLIIGP